MFLTKIFPPLKKPTSPGVSSNCSFPSHKNLIGTGPRKNKVSNELINNQGSLPPGSRMVPIVPMGKKSSKRGRRPTWMNKKLLSNLKHEQEIYRRWKQGQASWDEGTERRQVC